MQRRYLFVGGPADGEWRETDGEPTYLVSVMERGLLGLKTEAYALQPFQDNETRTYIYFHESIRPGALIHALLAGYKGRV